MLQGRNLELPSEPFHPHGVAVEVREELVLSSKRLDGRHWSSQFGGFVDDELGVFDRLGLRDRSYSVGVQQNFFDSRLQAHELH